MLLSVSQALSTHNTATAVKEIKCVSVSQKLLVSQRAYKSLWLIHLFEENADVQEPICGTEYIIKIIDSSIFKSEKL